MKAVKGLVGGPFKDEQSFKAAVLKKWRREYPAQTFFEVENEEKEPGMPDVLGIGGHNQAGFYEFKISDGHGVVEFQKTQPLFYRRHCRLLIKILAWDVPRGRVVGMEAAEVVEAKSLRIKIPEVLDEQAV